MARRIRLNMLCIFGVAIGIIGLLTPLIDWQPDWITSSFQAHPLSDEGGNAFSSILRLPSYCKQYYSAFDIIYSSFHSLMPGAQTLYILIAIIILGLALSLLTPVAGFIEFAGILGCLAFIYNIRIEDDYLNPSFTLEITALPNMGAWLILLSSLIIIMSFFLPLGIGLRERLPNMPVRFQTTFSVISAADEKTPPRYEFNYLAIVGASLALLGAVLPWQRDWVRFYSYPDLLSPFATLQSIPSSGTSEIFLSVAVFAFIILSFISPLSSGFLIPSEISLFIIYTRFGPAYGLPYAYAGFILTVLGSILVMLSYFLLVENDRAILRIGLRRRIWTVCRNTRPGSATEPRGETAERPRYMIHLNMLEMLSFGLGVLALSTPWLNDGAPKGVSIAPLISGWIMPSFSIAAIMFIIGLFANLLTSIGSVIQAAACGIFFGLWLGIAAYGIYPEIGLILAICSAVIGVSGIIWPVFLPNYKGGKESMNRFLSIIPA